MIKLNVLYNLLLIIFIQITITISIDSFTYIVIPDSQYLTAYFPSLFDNQINWACMCKDKLNIKVISHVGDIVDHFNETSEWDVAKKVWSHIDNNNIINGLAVGNHDRYIHNDYTFFQRYFAYKNNKSRFTYLGGVYNHQYQNNYQLFDLYGSSFITIHLEYMPNSTVTAWADTILKLYSERIAIIISHDIITDCHGYLSIPYNLEVLIINNCNVVLTLSGHFFYCGGENNEQITNICNNTVNLLTQDYQARTKGGDTWLRMLTFNKIQQEESVSIGDNWKICVFTYNPMLDVYELDNNSYFSFNINGEIEDGCVIQNVCSISDIQSGIVMLTQINFMIFLLALMLILIKTNHGKIKRLKNKLKKALIIKI